ncbi:MAG: hypothetical protein [Caudoviricetes sp.]|nr:MAG: hypothetical protein [Caudoviricetes sp.]
MSIQERRRKAFEAWYSQSWGHDDTETSLATFMLDEQGQYLYGHVHESFVVWSAALDSVEIELPGLFIQQPEKLYPTRWLLDAIESAGLKVKS